MTTSVTMYTDGSARGNPGPGGYGVVLLHEAADGTVREKELSQGYRLTTNNRMELLAVIVGLEALRRPCHVVLYSDSQYVVKAIDERWIDGWVARGWKTAGKKPVKNVDLWKRLMPLLREHDVEFRWVRGHAGNVYNERCDGLATAAADNVAAYGRDEVFEALSGRGRSAQ